MMNDSLNDNEVIKRNMSHRNMRFINEMKNQNWQSVLNESDSQTVFVNFMKLYPAISVPVSLTVKWPKHITEINRGCQLHSRNQSNEKISYMLIVKNVGILFYNATIRNIGTN